MRFGILKKFLLAFLTLSLVPLVVLSFYARQKIDATGRSAVQGSRQVLIDNATALLEARARDIARQVEIFLGECVDHLLALSEVTPDTAAYLGFSRYHKRQVWVRTGTLTQPGEARFDLPRYREVNYIDAQGVEQIRITDNRVHDPGRRFHQPVRTRYGLEDFYNQALKLAPGRVYVSHLKGRHIRRHEQLNGAPDVESAYGGRSYDGIVRFAVTRFENGRAAGVVAVALDHRHLMEYSQHVLPVGSREVVFPSYSSGNYAFLFDNEGWIITHPKFWDIRGFDADTGQLVDPRSASYTQAALKDGQVPFNLKHVPFVHPNYRHIALEVLAGRSGVTETASVAGVARILAFAPIHFDHGNYRQSGFFGGVTLGAQKQIFHRAVNATADRINEALHQTARHFILFIIAAGCAVGVIAVVLAKSFTRPILTLSQKANEIGQGRFTFPVKIHSGDELELLGRKFEEMGRQLDKQQKNLIQSVKALEASKAHSENTSRRLEKQVDILKQIHSIGHDLSVNFDKAEVLSISLKTCVAGIGFQRAILYLQDRRRQRLECAQTYGFSPELKRLAYRVAYRVAEHDCIATRVFRTGLAEMMTPSTDAATVTEIDRRILSRGEALAIAFAPIRVADRIIGVLGADHGALKGTIAEEELESLKIIANEAGMALERARLMDETIAERDFKESIFANMMSGLLVVDPAGIVRSVNPRAEVFLSRSARQLVGQPVSLALADYPLLQTHIQAAQEGREISSSDLSIPSAGGRQIHLEIAITQLKGDRWAKGASASVLVIFRDVTQSKQMEQHLRRSDRLVSLGTLAAGIAHEIRNPLTGISLLLDDLHDRMQRDKADRSLMQQALAEIEKLERIITELLEFASNPTSRRVTKDIDKVIDHTLFFVQKQCKQQKVVIRRRSHDPLPPIHLDPEKIKQALLNVILNALNVMPGGGEIDINARFLPQSELLQDRSAIELVIADTGPGIDPADIDYIFDPFFTRNPKGFGLGLSITHTIIEEHEGKIMVSSEAGQGACFKIHLPAIQNGKV
jgi:PAS domain S-box-containing protein